MKYCEDSTVEKLERGYVCKTQGHGALHACATWSARARFGARGHIAVREGAMRYARARCGTQVRDAERKCAMRYARARCGTRGCDAKRENTPMSDNLSKRRIHYAQNLYILQIIGLRCVFCLAFSRLSDIGV